MRVQLPPPPTTPEEEGAMSEGAPKSAVLDEMDIAVARRKVVGGGDVAAIVGVHPYKTAHDVWLEKLGLAVIEENEAMYWGKVLEPVILAEYERREGDTPSANGWARTSTPS